MATTINNTTAGITTTVDSTGVLSIQTAGLTAQTLGTDQSTTFSGTANLASTGSTTAPLKFTAGTNLTTQQAGVVEYDGTNFYGTVDTTTGRGSIPVLNQFKLLAAGTGITATATGTNYFGTTSNIPLVASAFYEIEVVFYYTVTTTNIRNFAFTFNAAPTSYDVYWEMSPAPGGLVAPPGTATMLIGQAYNSTATTTTVTTASLTTGTNHHARLRLPYLRCAAGTTSLSIYAYTSTSGTITPGIGSYWIARRLPATNIGTYAA